MPDSLAYQGYQRKYLVHVPPSYDGVRKAPALIFLHGGSGNILSAQNFTLLNPVSNRNGFLAVYPEGIAPTGNGGFVWADGRGTGADKLGIDDVGFVNTMIEALARKYALDTMRIYLAGFSNGGFLVQRIACEANARFAAIASLGSTIDIIQYPRCRPGRPIPMLLLAGTRDPFVPYGGGAMQGSVPDVISSSELFRFWTDNNRCRKQIDSLNLTDIDTSDSSTVTVFEYTECDCNANVQHVRINGGGHTWPGVELPSYELIAGQTNEDVQASELLWAFFSRYTLCSTVSAMQEPPAPARISLYPNPATGMVVVEAGSMISSIQVFDLRGSLIRQQAVFSQQCAFPAGTLIQGAYYIAVRTSDNRIATIRFMVQ
ncbi:MAG: T9SS type A sorting domain-containing protein [Ignavibacteria bacterium]|nr:T9SS type A sorting domain-containing protein [Ignavibacteria bacterium]